MSEIQEKWILNWVEKNLSGKDIEQAAKIAWQYDVPDDVVQKILNLA